MHAVDILKRKQKKAATVVQLITPGEPMSNEARARANICRPCEMRPQNKHPAI
jgi:hypothetical protein